MSFRDLIQDVFRTLWAHRVRTLLTMFGIAWGVVSIVLMVAAGEGLRVGQAKQAETLGRDLMIVFHGRTSLQAGGARAGRLVHWVDSDIPHLQEEAPDCQYAIPELEQGTRAFAHRLQRGRVHRNRLHPEFAEIRSLGVSEGRFYDQDDIAEGRRVAFLGSDAKKQLFGSRPAVGQFVYLNDIPFTVVGVMSSKKQDSSYDGWDINKIFIPFPAMRRDFPDKPPGTPETFDQLLVVPRSVEHHEACKGEIRRVLGQAARLRSERQRSLPHLGHHSGSESFPHHDRRHEVFSRRGGHRHPVSRRPRRHECDAGRGAGAHPRDWSPQSHRRAREQHPAAVFLEALIVALISGGTGLLIAFGLCALVDLLPMPDFFAGLLAHVADGSRGPERSRNHRHPVGLVSSAPRRGHRSHRSLAS
jgi:putative ABC transport system permease protein